MFKRAILVAIFFVNASVAFAAPEAKKANLRVSITNIANTRGSILVSVFKGPAGWPDDASKMHDKLKLTPAQAANFIIEGLDEGEYAIAVLHDENNNNKMDTSAGIPNEGFGFSNNKMNMFGPPSFKKAKFAIKAPGTSIAIKMKGML